MTESLTTQELHQTKATNSEEYGNRTEQMTEPSRNEVGTERNKAESIECDILKSYKDLGSAYEVSADTIRKDLKRIAAITEGFVTGFELTRKINRRVVVTAQGQIELAKYREMGADAYIRELQNIYAAGVEDEGEEIQDETQSTEPTTPAGKMVVRDDRNSAGLAQSDQQSAINAQASQLAQYSQAAANHQETQYTEQLESQQVEGLQDGALLAVQRHAATLEGFHRTIGHLNQTFLSQGTGRAASANLSGLADFTHQVGKQATPKKPKSQEFLNDLLGKFQ